MARREPTPPAERRESQPGRARLARPERIWVGEDEGHPALIADGAVYSVVPGGASAPGYWKAMIPDLRPRAALILGLGGGTVARLLVHRFGPVPMVAVEIDPRAVEVARSGLGLDLPNLEIVVADAFAYVASCTREFDFICVDLFMGNQFERGVLAKPFLRRLEALLAPRGWAVFNLFADRRTELHMRRLDRVLSVDEYVRAGKNTVVWCRRRG